MSNQIDSYLTGSNNSISIFTKTLMNLGILSSTPGALYTAGTSEGLQVQQTTLDKMASQNGTLTMDVKVKTGSGLVGATMNVVSLGPDASGKEIYEASITGFSGTVIGDSVAAIAAEALGTVMGVSGAVSIELIVFEVVIAAAVVVAAPLSIFRLFIMSLNVSSRPCIAVQA